MNLKKVLFIDRDGTLISEPSINFQIDSLDKLMFEQDVISSLIILKNLNFKFVMITNQDGLGTDSFFLTDFSIPHQFMLNVFQSQGITFEEVLICPHTLTDNCLCRKPKLGMVQHWIQDSLLVKEQSFVIGDRLSDMELAKNMGIKGIHYGKNGCTWKTILQLLIGKNRYSKVIRNTLETKVNIEVWLDSSENSTINTGLEMFNHMLHQIAIHSGMCMNIKVDGDLLVDDHHTVEDVAIVLGEAILKAIGNKLGLSRFGFVLPMDESIGFCILDFSGRPYLKFDSDFKYQYIGDISSEMVKHFFRSLAFSMKITLHLKSVGLDVNDHHRLESLFKVFGRTLKQAISLKGNMLPSSKGLL